MLKRSLLASFLVFIASFLVVIANPSVPSASAARCTSTQKKDTATYEFSTTSTITATHTGSRDVGAGARGGYNCEKIPTSSFKLATTDGQERYIDSSNATCASYITFKDLSSISGKLTGGSLTTQSGSGGRAGGCKVESTKSIQVDVSKLQDTAANSAGAVKLKELLNNSYNSWLARCNSMGGGSRQECITTSNTLWDNATKNCYTSTKNTAVGVELEDKLAECINSFIPAIPVTSVKADLDGNTQEIRDAAATAELGIKTGEATSCGDGEVADDNGECQPATSCAVDGIGWIVCPAMKFLGSMNDAAFGFLNNFLEVPARLFNDTATKAAWETFRNLANVAFIFAFLVIIYSQITSAGVSNYGIKKLLPKLVIAAVLVNISFYICAILVDLSNVFGSGLYSLLKNMNAVSGTVSGGGAGSEIWTNVIGGALIGAGVIALLAVIIFAPMTLLAFALVMIILVGRQAFVILLIVISPLAFVAYLLPNTEQWFKRWWKSLTTMLMVFPIIALVFGASSLASNILLAVSEDCKGSTLENCAENNQGTSDDDQTLKIAAAAVLAIPLFAVPALLKGSMAAAGSIGGKIAGLQGRANGMAGKSLKNGRIGEAKGAFDRRLASNRAERRMGKGKGIRARGNKFLDSTRVGRALGAERGQASAIHAVDKEWGETTGMHQGLYSHNSASDEELLNDMSDTSLTSEKRAAAAGLLMKRSRGAQNKAMRSAVSMASKGDDEAIGGIQKQMAQDMGSRKPLGLGSAAAAELNRGKLGAKAEDGGDSGLGTDSNYNFNDEIAKRAVAKVAAANIPEIDPDDLQEITKAVEDGRIQGASLNALHSNITKAYGDERINARIDGSARTYLDQIVAKKAQNDAFGTYVTGNNVAQSPEGPPSN